MTIAIAKVAQHSSGLSIPNDIAEVKPDEHFPPTKPTTFPRWALGLGSIAPDIPLFFLSFGGFFYFGSYLNWPTEKAAKHLFSNLFYNDPAWITLHNFLHSPTMLLILGLANWPLRSRFPKLTRWSLYFLAACALHSIVDILTHNDDGPLMFFPFNWTYRFSSPVSYWDIDHHGGAFMIFEGMLNLILLAALLMLWWFSPTFDSKKINK